ncbi:hypothetical protein MITS9508_01001 [Synechococcus sp. MIT S9508]|nr:hypothetical protein MITS9508_01001 [Synechococcus sp. MIT S9508]
MPAEGIVSGQGISTSRPRAVFFVLALHLNAFIDRSIGEKGFVASAEVSNELMDPAS